MNLIKLLPVIVVIFVLSGSFFGRVKSYKIPSQAERAQARSIGRIATHLQCVEDDEKLKTKQNDLQLEE